MFFVFFYEIVIIVLNLAIVPLNQSYVNRFYVAVKFNFDFDDVFL